jgi:hypothetical protein
MVISDMTEISETMRERRVRMSSLKFFWARISVNSETTDFRDLIKWVPAGTLPLLAFIATKNRAPWVCMCALVLGLFFGAKWITVFRSCSSLKDLGPRRLAAYLLLWPGMDFRALCAKSVVPTPAFWEWTFAAAKTLFGAALLWVGVPLFGPEHPLVIGWTGMIAIVFLVHFGAFHLLSLFWRAFGINARPIMRSPMAATSLSRFWGRSWNTAFSDLMREHSMALGRRFFPLAGFFIAFLISGLLHEIVISVPARGGYGLPTWYFAIQGLGVLMERTEVARAIGLGSGWKGWCFVALVAGVPAYWLFSPTFVYRVILPMLHAVGAT